jgi:ribonuclease H / adenosylcobalamin/alpha-ribazole phosphatase
MAQRWPSTLWIVRHGQSAGNVARDLADQAGHERIDIASRDVDVPLSELGEAQAAALGAWFAGLPDRPQAVLASPYLRAIRTAELIGEGGGFGADVPICRDERLREKEFGILDGLTTAGITARLPEQRAFRQLLGKFYHRPPGGESWCDVILRLRSVLDTIALHHAESRVLIVAHQVVVLCLRYILEGMDEATILGIDREGDVANCSVTEFAYDPAAGRWGGMRLVRYNDASAVAEVAVTRAPDPMVAARG